MVLKDVHDTLEEIPEQYRDLYTEKAGKFECTGITGMKTSLDVSRVTNSLEKERGDHKATKESLAEWDGFKFGEVTAKLDRMEELEAAAGGNLDESKIEEIANKRAEAMTKTRVSPLERQIKTLEKSNGELNDSNTTLLGAANTRQREDLLRPLLIEMKVMQEHHEDAFLYSERHLEKTEEGHFIVRDGITGLTAGATARDWLTEMLEKRPGWLPPSVGGGSRGSGSVGGLAGSSNPWSNEGWNMTQQGVYLKTHGTEKAAAAAKAAGTSVGGGRPQPKK